jgi:Asp-tRNA(Asn)/Glu-tRNA(Gln) amidotransferase A subunit family amidase
LPDFANAPWDESIIEPFYSGLNPDIDQAVNGALAVLRDLTASARDVELPACSGTVLAAEMYASQASTFATSAADYQPTTRSLLEIGSKILAPAYIEALQGVDALMGRTK